MASEIPSTSKRAKTSSTPRSMLVTDPKDIPTAASCVSDIPTLVYWDIRGLAQPIRLALEQAGVEYNDVRIEPGTPGTDGYKQVWLSAKPSVGLVPINLPYLMDGDVQVAQSGAVLRHVGRKYGLLGEPSDLQASAAIDLALEECNDFDGRLTRMCYGSYNDGGKEAWLAQSGLPGLAVFEALLATRSFFAGDQVSIADFKVYESIAKCRLVEASVLNDFPHLSAFMDRIEALPRIADYLSCRPLQATPN